MSTALDVCCGAGGMSLGLQRAGFDVHGVELNADACDTHRRHVGECEVFVCIADPRCRGTIAEITRADMDDMGHGRLLILVGDDACLGPMGAARWDVEIADLRYVVPALAEYVRAMGDEPEPTDDVPADYDEATDADDMPRAGGAA